ncbi:hypothetical protein DNTS_035101 [Danionella cerebrum]|uniref:Uncharacterized protein n=1 Tax=Danionella cerebrum TaxID=2873325 RepID=A0A553PIK8_9TELE|nr:hypothetical protein DNTS_035101 [Danionella translucida]
MSRIAKIKSATSIALVTGDIKDCMVVRELEKSRREERREDDGDAFSRRPPPIRSVSALVQLNLQDAFDDDKTTPKPTVKPTVNPAPPQNPNPADPEPKKPVVPPKEKGTGGGSFGDSDLIDVNEGGEYMPDGGRSGGRGADVQSDDSSDKPEDLAEQWLQLFKMLSDNIPDGLSVWIGQFKQVVDPLLKQLREFLNVTEEKAEL